MDTIELPRLHAWGQKKRVHTGLKDHYDYLVEKYPEWFPALTDLFEISAALGIAHDEQKELSKNEELANLADLDTAVFSVLMSMRFPSETPEQRLEELERFAEYGIAKLHEEITAAGDVGFTQYLKPALDACSDGEA